jgi:hypothetical protein
MPHSRSSYGWTKDFGAGDMRDARAINKGSAWVRVSSLTAVGYCSRRSLPSSLSLATHSRKAKPPLPDRVPSPDAIRSLLALRVDAGVRKSRVCRAGPGRRRPAPRHLRHSRRAAEPPTRRRHPISPICRRCSRMPRPPSVELDSDFPDAVVARRTSAPPARRGVLCPDF